MRKYTRHKKYDKFNISATSRRATNRRLISNKQLISNSWKVVGRPVSGCVDPVPTQASWV